LERVVVVRGRVAGGWEVVRGWGEEGVETGVGMEGVASNTGTVQHSSQGCCTAQ
jgi:hypothetical protein